jgi:hypothetical protein
MSYSNSLFLKGGGSPNQSAGDFSHHNAFLCIRPQAPPFFRCPLPTTTELLVLNLIPQHDPHPDSELASHRYSRLPETFLDQFAAVKTLQLWIPANRVYSRFTPEK